MRRTDGDRGYAAAPLSLEDSARGRAPGKTTLTSRLPIQRREDGSSTPSEGSPAAPALLADPFGPDITGVAQRGIDGFGQPLPHGDDIQRAFGRHDVGNVVAHIGGAAATACEDLHAVGYATGNDVAFARPPTLELAAHEAAHVVQQRHGVAFKSNVSRPDDPHEAHADEVAAAVVRGDPAEPLLDRIASGGGPTVAVQRKESRNTATTMNRSDVEMAARRVADEAVRLAEPASAGNPVSIAAASGSDASIAALLDTAWLLISIVETRDELAPTELASLASAASALAGLRSKVGEDGAAQIGVVSEALRSRVEAKGAQLPASPAAALAGASSSPIEQLALVRRTIAAKADQRGEFAVRAGVARSLVPLLRDAERIAGSVRDRKALEEARRQVDGIGEEIQDWFEYARWARIGQAEAGLDEVFAAEDKLNVAVARVAPGRRALFYKDLTATRWRGEGDDAPVEGRRGGDFLDIIVAWFSTKDPLRVMLGLHDLSTMLREPVKTREPSLLEKVIARAVQTLLGMIPGYIGGLVTGAAGAIATGTPRKPESADLAELRSYSRSPAPPPADARPELAKLTKAADYLPTALAPIVGAVGPHHGAAPAGQRGAAITGDRKDDRPLASAFTIQLSAGVTAMTTAALEESSPLRAGLELVTPEGLEEIWTRIKSEHEERAAEVRAGLVMQWANVVAAATNGLDADGTNAHGGTIEQALEMPGTVQIAATVRNAAGGPPVVNAERVTITGLSASALYELRTAARPLSAIAMQRVVEVDRINEDGFPVRVGTIDFGPTGQIDLDRANWDELALIAGGSAPPWAASPKGFTLEDRGPVTRAMAEAGARLVLASANKTTADID